MPEGPVPLSGDAPEAEGWTTETLLTGLEQPWAVAWLPGGELLITERPGRLLRISPDFQQSEPVAGLPQIYADGQGGLMDLSLHPNFEENRMVYLIYASGDEDANRTTIGRGELNGNELTGFEEIFRVSPDKDGDQHFGSRMVWLDDSTFVVAIGDGGNRPQQTRGVLSREHAQMLDSHLGKILRLNEDGSTADGNPFADQEGAYPQIWTLGHRNIQGLALDADSGRLWANEHGSRGGDELNLIQEGENYGWPEVTYSREYWYTSISDETSKPGMTDPKVVWTPAQAPSGLAFYTGDVFPDWQGDLFSGGLQGEQVRRIMLDGQTVTGEEKIPIGRRVRDVRQGPDGYLYVLTGHDDGELIRIVPEE
jgi:aldose sugar dehydrogenase